MMIMTLSGFEVFRKAIESNPSTSTGRLTRILHMTEIIFSLF